MSRQSDAAWSLRRIELYADGMEDADDGQLSIADRLLNLRNRRENWRQLLPRLYKYPLSTTLWNAYELVDGVFAQTQNWATVNSSKGIQFASLPSRFSPGTVIQYENVGFAFRDFAMDPTQDLVIYMQCDDLQNVHGTHVVLHIRTMSTNKAHPLGKPHSSTRHETLTMTSGVIEGAVIQIVDDVVGFMSWCREESKLFIWDWRRGKLLVSEQSLESLDDFSFLSPRAYVLSRPGRHAWFRVYSFSSESGPKLHATLYLPLTRADSTVALIGIHTGPFTTSGTPPPSIRPPRPFRTKSDARVHVVNIDFLHGPDPDDHRVQCLVIVHNRTFLSYIKESEEPVIVQWDQWGRENTYWIMGLTGSQWLRYVHGERLVRLHRPTTESSERISEIQIYDFGAMRGPNKFMTKEERTERLFLSTQELLIDSVFPEPIHFSLPCRIIRRQEARPSLGFMVGDDLLIGVKRSTFSTNLDVYVL
ncbi:hypothetical protein M422DRAFT_256830 [Sphaerobolus stellatus SS14]|uniref:Uncharacterized protein n=1 Tax=Sphaerobolus stellatus (strain SS14) TaxID=990650 RepID=A0A0C9UZI3_SPHS4|nr:hypothetical protein M422DRAFT_256830 [Sphaerobolus stellatus SS14]